MRQGSEVGEEWASDGQLALGVGRVARDTERRRTGIVMEVASDFVRLRSLVNGAVWKAEVNSVRQVSAREELSIRLAAANARARGRI